MVGEKKARAEKVKKNYLDNTEEIKINGKVCRVNKYEAKALKAKMEKSKKFK